MSPIPFDSRLPKCYDTAVSTGVIHERITKKVRYSRLQRVTRKPFVKGKVKGDHLGGVRAKQKGTTRSKEIRYTDKNKLSVTGGRRWSRWKIRKR